MVYACLPPGIVDMRMVFVFLLILNILFAGWQFWRPQQTGSGVAALPSHLSRIELMRERVNPGSGIPAASMAKEGKEPGRGLCHTLGPFTDGQMTEALKQQMQQFTKKLTLRIIEENELHRYWVYMRAKNHEDAVEVSKALAEKNISDYYIMNSAGEKRVSLGHFREKAYADKRLQQVESLGFEANSEVIYRQYQLYWLDYELIEKEKSRFEAFIAPYLQNEISILNRDCEKIVY
jgi:hypothetical protein